MRQSSAGIKERLFVAVMAVVAWTLVSPASGNGVPDERVIHLQGTTNTRDIGGYQTGDMRTLRRGQIIRSENLSRLTVDDFQKLEELGVKTVVDLRSDWEHDRAPTVWQGDNPPQFYHFPIGDADDDWFIAQRKLMKRSRFTEEQALQHMVEGYRMIADTGTPSYREMMKVVLDQSNWPVLIHCTAGKDRSGIAVTLILEALGVDRATIMEEYLLTNEVGHSEEKAALLSRRGMNAAGGKRLGRGPSASAWFPIVGVLPEMLEAFYVTIDEQHGSMDAFLTELGVDRDARTALAASLTTEQPKLVMGE